MTREEKIIATAFTGTMFIDGSEMKILYEYMEKKVGHGVIDLMLVDKGFWGELRKACKQDFIDMVSKGQPEVFDTIAFQKGVQEGRRLEREDALTIADIEKLHTFLYAVMNNKHGVFTFTRLSDEQYEEVLRRFNNAKEK